MSADLSKISLFQGLPAADLAAVAGRVTLRTLPVDSVVFTEGGPGDSLYLILSGKVKVYLHDANGKEFIVDVRNAGGYVGEMMLDGSPRSASVKTLEPSEFGVLSRNDFNDLLRQNPEVSLHLIRNLIRLTRGHNVRTLQDVRTRGELQTYIEQLKTSKAEDLPSVRRWFLAKRWVLVGLLAFAVGQYYFLGVLLEMMSISSITFLGSR
ncbi:MAG TPA: cyclic nucleotide-binding domain-containing protein [Burkholderiales bacterium]|nr:cyclic nucleotide-binding domain-containing protein [Burkholderiales bacterium]